MKVNIPVPPTHATSRLGAVPRRRPGFGPVLLPPAPKGAGTPGVFSRRSSTPRVARVARLEAGLASFELLVPAKRLARL